MKTQIYITQKLYNKKIEDSSFYGFFAIRELENGEREFYQRDCIGTWKKIEDKKVIDYYLRSKPIKIDQAMADTEFTVKYFQRTKPRIQRDDFSFYEYGEPNEDISYLDKKVAIFSIMPDGNLIAESSFIEKHEEKYKCPIDFVTPVFLFDGNYTLEDSDEVIDQTKIAARIKSEFETQMSQEQENAK